jgi:hypothetical protein
MPLRATVCKVSEAKSFAIGLGLHTGKHVAERLEIEDRTAELTAFMRLASAGSFTSSTEIPVVSERALCARRTDADNGAGIKQTIQRLGNRRSDTRFVFGAGFFRQVKIFPLAPAI